MADIPALRRIRGAAPLLPFLGFVAIFLIVPSVTVLVGAFLVDGSLSGANIAALFDGPELAALGRSLALSASSAALGAIFGAVLAGLIVGGRADSVLRRTALAMCGVLAQFGGVALAFAFMATFGVLGLTGGWLYGLPGLILVYTYFQIPLMVIVFLPALEGLRRQWREAAVSLGASRWQYWREVGAPLLWPMFAGSALLLFANAFAAYATAAALVTQGSPILPLLIRSALTSEVMLGQTGLAYALACEMIVVVAAVMAGYARLVRRTSRWLT